MKNLNFVVRGLVFVALLLVSNSLVAQSSVTEYGSFVNVTAKDSPFALENADLANSNQAIETLEENSIALRDAQPSGDLEQNQNQLRMMYYRHLWNDIQNNGSSVENALLESQGYLTELFTKFNDDVVGNMTFESVYQDAIELLSL